MRSVGLLLVLMSATAAAQDAPPRSPERRVGVLVLGVTPADRELADALAEVLIAAVADSPGRARMLVGKEELQAALGQDDEASLVCLASPACLGRLGVQLSLDELVAASLGRREAGFAFDLGRYDPRTGARLAHLFLELEGTDEAALATALTHAFADLGVVTVSPPQLAELRIAFEPSDARVQVDGREMAEPMARLEPGRHVVRVEADGHRSVERIIDLRPGEQRGLDIHLAPLPAPTPTAIAPPPPRLRVDRALVIGGSALVGAGLGLALGFGLRARDSVGEGATRADAQRFVSDRERDARVANAGFALAAIGLLTSTVGASLWWRRSRITPHLSLHPSGAFVALELRR